MDQIDKAIIQVLKENGRAATSIISKKVNLSIPAVTERIRKLEEMKVIEKYLIKVNREQYQLRLLAFVFLTIDQSENIKGFLERVLTYPQVLECHHIAGEYDYLLKVVVEDTRKLEDFISNKLKIIKGVQNTNTIIAMSTLKEEINV